MFDVFNMFLSSSLDLSTSSLCWFCCFTGRMWQFWHVCARNILFNCI